MATERQYNTAVFILRALQAGLRIEDLGMLEIGTVTDIIIESGNDHAEYSYVATQEDFNRF